jgi:mannosyl-3-phosphoglycerate phosphatase
VLPAVVSSEIDPCPISRGRDTLIDALLAPHHLIFTAVEGALIDPRTRTHAPANDALQELERLKIPWILMSPGTRAQLDPIRRNLGHGHPFVTEMGGGIFLPDGYFNVKIPGIERRGRYLCVPLGRPYKEVCEELDDLAEECGIGLTGFHSMSPREIGENTGVRLRDAELLREREFDELFFFTTADDEAIARFTERASELGFRARPGNTFWRFSAGCNPATAVRKLTKLIQEASPVKLHTVGVGASEEDLEWLSCVSHAVMLPGGPSLMDHAAEVRGGNIAVGDTPGPAGWNSYILNIIG